MMPIALGMPECENAQASAEAGMLGPRVASLMVMLIMMKMMKTMATREALASLVMSLYRERGRVTNRVATVMMKGLLAKTEEASLA